VDLDTTVAKLLVSLQNRRMLLGSSLLVATIFARSPKRAILRSVLTAREVGAIPVFTSSYRSLQRD